MKDDDDEGEVQKLLDAVKSAAAVMDNNPIAMSFAGTERFGGGRVVYTGLSQGLDEVKALYANLEVPGDEKRV